MNSVVLKGKLGAGFNDDRYTLPKDGSAGDILVRTETGSAWESPIGDMIEENMLPAVKIGNDILGVHGDILMM